MEMECATWCIVANYLGMEFGQFLYFSDAVTTNDWFMRAKQERTSFKQLMTKLSYDIALKM